MGIGNWLLNGVEKAGNKLPDPVFIFVWLIAILMGVSVLGSTQGWQVVNPVTQEVIQAQSLFSSENMRKLFQEMPKTLTGFAPLGYVLVVMLGAGVAERTGLFGSAMKAGVRQAPKALLTPIVIFVAIVANHAADAAYVVLIPLAAALYAARVAIRLSASRPASPGSLAASRPTSSRASSTPCCWASPSRRPG